MGCVSDSSHMLVVLIGVNVLVYCQVCLRTTLLFFRLLLSLNFSFLGVMVLQYYAPDRVPDDMLNHVLLHLSLLLGGMLILTLAGDVLTMTSILILLGPFWNAARVDLGAVLNADPSGPGIVVFSVVLFLVLLWLVVKCASSRRLWYVIEQLAVTFFGWIAVNIAYLLSTNNNEMCCDGSASQCPFTLSWPLAILFVVLLILRIWCLRAFRRRLRPGKTDESASPPPPLSPLLPPPPPRYQRVPTSAF
jgi:hypothetical protein